MKYAAVIEYISDTAKVGEIRPLHRAYLTSLQEAGKLVVAGPFLDDFGSLIVYEANSPEEAEELIRNDPFHANGIFVRWTVRPWKTVFGNPQLLPPNG
ncbi:MAG: YciI family protein [Fimbriiglobus sp.]